MTRHLTANAMPSPRAHSPAHAGWGRVSAGVQAAALAAMLSAVPAWAQMPDGPKLAEFGGQMHAAAQACGHYSAAELQTMKAQQKSHSEQQGLSASAFDAGFQKGFDAGMAKLKGLSEAERAKMCGQMEAMSRMKK